jgi:hypothetical protein
VEDAAQRVEGLGADPERLGEGRSAGRDEHELLEVDRVLGVCAAVHDVEERHGQRSRAVPAEVAEERHPRLGRRRLRRGERHAEDRVRPQATLVRRPVELDEPPVESLLVGGVEPAHRGRDLATHVLHRTADALAAPVAAAVTELERLVDTGRGAGGHRGPPGRARLEPHLGLDGGIAARVEDLARADLRDRRHSNATFARSK